MWFSCSDWEVYNVEVRALTIRGALRTRFTKEWAKSDGGSGPHYELECWDDIVPFTQKQADEVKECITLKIRRPKDSTSYYSSINIRLYSGDKTGKKSELRAVTSIPVEDILRAGWGWQNLLDVLWRDPKRLAVKAMKLWHRFVLKKRAARGGYVADPAAANDKSNKFAYLSVGKESKEKGLAQAPPPPSPGMPSPKAQLYGVAGTSVSTSTAAPLLPNDSLPQKSGHELNEIRLDIKSDEKAEGKSAVPVLAPTSSNAQATPKSSSDQAAEHQIEGNPSANPTPDMDIDPIKLKEARAKMLQPRDGVKLDETTGLEIHDPASAVVQTVQCEQIQGKDPGSPWERHWVTGCEYELLPLTRAPFQEYDVWTGKDEVHLSFIEKVQSVLFVENVARRTVGTVRGNFFAYKDVDDKNQAPSEADRKNERLKQPARNNFNSELYKEKGARFGCRVYLLRGLGVFSGSGSGRGDPYFTLSVNTDTQRSDPVEADVNPKYYKSFDFPQIEFPGENTILTIQAWDASGIGGHSLIGETSISLENRLYSNQWDLVNGRRPMERRALYNNERRGRMPQGFVEVCVDIMRMADFGRRPLDYLLNPPKRVPWEMRVILYRTRHVTPKKIYHGEDECCCCEICLPPNQSDVSLVCGLAGAKQEPSSTDVHVRCIDGEALFNWRTIHNIELPAPEPYCNLKVQIWNINWKPDDCIAEAVIPLWGFTEFARRRYESEQNADEKALAPKDRQKAWLIDKQWIKLVHPQNDDKGEVELAIELVPKVHTTDAELRAAAGPDGWTIMKNSSTRVIEAPVRPPSSFPWYRLDLQILWRISYCWKKTRWYVLGLMILIIGVIVGAYFLQKEMNK